jgi:hypothetical protein
MRKLKTVLPWIALASALVAAGLLVAGSLYRRAQISDTGETRAVVEKALADLLERRPASLDDPDFRTALSSLAASNYVGWVWLVDINSNAVTLTSDRGLQVDRSITTAPQDEAILDSLPRDEFSEGQILLLKSLMAMHSGQADHDDVFATLVRSVRNPAGELLGAIGVSYDRSPWVGAAPSVLWIAITLGFAFFLGVYWLSIPAWTLLDARERGERAWVWAGFTLVGNVIALLAYLLARAPREKGRG